MPASQDGPGHAPAGSGVLRGWLVLFAVFFALYATTASRGAQWQDSGFHILRAVTGEVLNPRGLALSHPLHHWIARLVVWPGLLEPCFAVTLISAVAGAVAVANLFACVLTLTRRWPAAVLAAASLGLAHTFWQLATLAETYTLCAALLAGECWCLVAYARTRRKRLLWALLLLNGLGVANHLLAALTTPVLVFVVVDGLRRRKIRGHEALVAAALWVLGSLPYSGMVLAELVRTGEFLETVRSALFGHAFSDNVLNTTLSPKLLAISVGFMGYSFPNLLLPVVAYGLTQAGRLGPPRMAVRALLAGLAIHAVFALRYNIVDQHLFFLPLYVLLCVFGGVGLAAVLHWQRRGARRCALTATVGLLAATPVVYAVFPHLARQIDLLGPLARNKPYRNDYAYLFVPWSVAERSAEQLSRQAVEQAGERGLILVEDGMATFALRYRALRAGRAELEIVAPPAPEPLRRAIEGGRTVVLVPADADAPATAPPLGSWERFGDLYIWTSEPSTATPTSPP